MGVGWTLYGMVWDTAGWNGSDLVTDTTHPVPRYAFPAWVDGVAAAAVAKRGLLTN
jgi:hypothetical protein